VRNLKDRERLARLWESVPLDNPSRRVEMPRGELGRSEGKVAMEIASLDRRVTALETEGTKRAAAPLVPLSARKAA